MASAKTVYTADFETTTDTEDCRVWAWAVSEVGNPDNFHYGVTLDGFMKFMEESDNSTFLFHNLRFDSDFIFVWLFEHGFTHVQPPPYDPNSKKAQNKDHEKSKTFSTVISDMGQFYSVKIIFNKTGKKTHFVTLLDSLKVLPFSVSEVAKGFGLPIQKLDLDYKTYRSPGQELTPHEVQYIRHDVEIMSRAIDILYGQGMTKITTASNALNNYRKMLGEPIFKNRFPIIPCDEFIRKSYRGGFTYASPNYDHRDVYNILTLDVNSLYPWVMRECLLPYGQPIYYIGKYVQDDLYNLYVQKIRCCFKLKEGHIPCIQLKDNKDFPQTEYVTDTGWEPVEMVLTNIDLQLLYDHYDVDCEEYICGWKFKSTNTLFRDYIDYWMGIKIQADKDGNKPMRLLAKLMLNSLYGKFGTSPEVANKIPYYSEGSIGFETTEKELRDLTKTLVYVPLASFVTAHARNKTIRSAQKMYNKFCYADTDSLHLHIELPEELQGFTDKELSKLTVDDFRKYGVDFPEDFEISPVDLGAWKVEGKFYRGRFLRAKCYIEDSNPPETWDNLVFNTRNIEEFAEDIDIEPDQLLLNYKGYYDKSKLHITCAGMPKRCHEFVSWGNFWEGSTYSGKLLPKHVKGGTVLIDTEFTIKDMRPAMERIREKRAYKYMTAIF